MSAGRPKGSGKPIEYKEVPCIYPELGNCHICTSHSYSKRGYVHYWNNGKYIQMHRFSYQEHKGVIPEGKLVRHLCDTPSCINPLHLDIGTVQDNTNDMIKRNRGVYRGNTAKGKKHGASNAKLSENEIRLIRNDTTHNQRELSKIFGVSNQLISMIKNYKIWKEVV